MDTIAVILIVFFIVHTLMSLAEVYWGLTGGHEPWFNLY